MEAYRDSVIKHFSYYKALADKTFAQVPDEGLFWQYNSESNSIAMIVQHLSGNMLSRWTDFLNTDGEKVDRNRDAEFEVIVDSRADLIEKWEAGWNCMFGALNSIREEYWDKTIYIRGQAHDVVDAINRQLAHVPYHVGQIVFIGKMIAGEDWKSLSIAKGMSASFNAAMDGKDEK